MTRDRDPLSVFAKPLLLPMLPDAATALRYWPMLVALSMQPRPLPAAGRMVMPRRLLLVLLGVVVVKLLLSPLLLTVETANGLML
jgi:hypothetical protein